MTTRPSRFHRGPVVPTTRSSSLECSPVSQNSKFLVLVDGSLQNFVRSTLLARFEASFGSTSKPVDSFFKFSKPRPSHQILAYLLSFARILECSVLKISVAASRSRLWLYFPNLSNDRTSHQIFSCLRPNRHNQDRLTNSGLPSCFHLLP